jgi:hypothetical protein
VAATSKLFSTASAQDSELESALDELLNDAMQEAENPTYSSELDGKDAHHVEGSRSFPRDLVDMVRLLYALLLYFVVVLLVDC